MARRKDKMIREKIDYKERKMEKSKRIKHTTWAHEDDTWNVMCARQTYDLSHACACHQLCNTEKNVTCEMCCSHPPVGCSRLLSAVNDLTTTKKNIAKCHFWAALWRNCTTGLTVLYAALSRARMCLTYHYYFSWAPPGIVPLPPRCAGWRRRPEAISSIVRKESVRVALLQTHGEDGAILLRLRWSLIGVSLIYFCQIYWERSTNSFCI